MTEPTVAPIIGATFTPPLKFPTDYATPDGEVWRIIYEEQGIYAAFKPSNPNELTWVNAQGKRCSNVSGQNISLRDLITTRRIYGCLFVGPSRFPEIGFFSNSELAERIQESNTGAQKIGHVFLTLRSDNSFDIEAEELE